jgi:hypothetical protein
MPFSLTSEQNQTALRLMVGLPLMAWPILPGPGLAPIIAADRLLANHLNSSFHTHDQP